VFLSPFFVSFSFSKICFRNCANFNLLVEKLFLTIFCCALQIVFWVDHYIVSPGGICILDDINYWDADLCNAPPDSNFCSIVNQPPGTRDRVRIPDSCTAGGGSPLVGPVTSWSAWTAPAKETKTCRPCKLRFVNGLMGGQGNNGWNCTLLSFKFCCGSVRSVAQCWLSRNVKVPVEPKTTSSSDIAFLSNLWPLGVKQSPSLFVTPFFDAEMTFISDHHSRDIW